MHLSLGIEVFKTVLHPQKVRMRTLVTAVSYSLDPLTMNSLRFQFAQIRGLGSRGWRQGPDNLSSHNSTISSGVQSSLSFPGSSKDSGQLEWWLFIWGDVESRLSSPEASKCVLFAG